MTITGAIQTTAGDTLDAHANLLAIGLPFNKVLFRATTPLCSLPLSHPLHSIMCTAKVKPHQLPIHNLLFLLCLNPGDIKIVNAVRHCLDYQPSFDQFICDTKDNVFTIVTILHFNYVPVQNIFGWLRLQGRNQYFSSFTQRR